VEVVIAGERDCCCSGDGEVEHGGGAGWSGKAVFDEFRQTYGCRRYARELNDRRMRAVSIWSPI